MSDGIDLERLLFLLHGDRELFERLCEAELLPRSVSSFTFEQAETARVVGTLVHELEVNWSGVEVVLHMRSELVTTRRALFELARVLREKRDLPGGGT